jgi:hypothetical protein
LWSERFDGEAFFVAEELDPVNEVEAEVAFVGGVKVAAADELLSGHIGGRAVEGGDDFEGFAAGFGLAEAFASEEAHPVGGGLMIVGCAGSGLVPGIEEHLEDAGLEAVIAPDEFQQLLAFLFAEGFEAAVLLGMVPVVAGLRSLDIVDAEAVPRLEGA